MSLVNTPIVGAQISEVYKWLCFVGYLSHSMIPRSAGRMDDIQSVLEYVSKHRARDLSESGAWWDSFLINRENRLYTAFLINGIRSIPREETLGLTAHLKRSLPFLFSEFRGLALALRSARDSEAHGFQGEAMSSFNSSYGVMVIRLFDLADRMHGLVLQIAAANREEAGRFQFRLFRPTSEEYLPLRARILAELSQWDSLREASSSNLSDEQGYEMAIPAVREAGYDDIISDIGILLSEKLSAHSESINGLLEGLRDEFSVAREDLRSDLLRSSNSIHALLTTKVEAGMAGNSVIDPVESPSRLGPNELTRALLDLRDTLYQQMVHAVPGFKHYHNILQKPIITEAVSSGVCSYGDYRLLPQFQSRIIGMSRSFGLAQQEELVGNEIEGLLARRQPL